VPVVALALGLASNVIDGSRLNILAFPLLGMLAWNLVVYLWLLLAPVRRLVAGRSRSHPIIGFLERLVQPASARLAAQPTLERGVARFARDWANVAGGLTRRRASRTLHLGAALFAIGVLAGMLLRARYTAEYSAGWSGTWAGAEREIAWLLGLILGPASALTGIALPTAERLRDLRGGGENAGNWLILWAVTAALFVVIPRLLLALWNGTQEAVLRRRLPVPGHEDFYVRSLLRNATGRAVAAHVLPYSFAPPPAAVERLRTLLAQALGEKTQVTVDPVAYGEEDAWLAERGSSLGDADHLVLLFNLGSTPEAENHGAFASGVRDRLAANGAGLTLLLDESSFRHKLRGDPSVQRRLEARVDAWKAVLAPTGLDPVVISLDAPDEAASARTLEQAMLRTPVPA